MSLTFGKNITILFVLIISIHFSVPLSKTILVVTWRNDQIKVCTHGVISFVLYLFSSFEFHIYSNTQYPSIVYVCSPPFFSAAEFQHTNCSITVPRPNRHEVVYCEAKCQLQSMATFRKKVENFPDQ